MATNSTRLGAETDFIKHDADNMVLLGSPHIDNLLTIVVALGAEIWTGQQRARITETLLTKHGKVTTEMIEKYVPTAEEQAKWADERKAMVERIYSVLGRNTNAANAFGSTEPNIARK